MSWLWRQLFRIRTKLLLINALIVAVPLLGVGFARLYEREMLAAVEADMVHQSQVIAELLEPGSGNVSEMLRRAAHQTTTRLRVLDASGTVVADSAGVVGEPLATRREVSRALAGRYGASTRVIPKRAVSVMFTAVPRRGGGVVYASRSTNSVQVVMHRLRRRILTVLIIALAATAILTLFFSTTISRPLAALATRARRLASGDRRVDLSLTRRDEIGELARALGDMATELDGRSAEVAELAANISHELKSPLTSMRGAAELLLDGAADDRVAREKFLGNILCDVDRLDRLVTRMLELSRVRSDTEEFALVDLGELAREASRDATTDGRILVSAPRDGVSVLARSVHLAAAIRNLVENAIVHSEPEQPVIVRVTSDRKCANVDICNQGEPIPVRAQAQIFERFYTTRASQGGTGLGLPIAIAAASAHGGQVSLVSSDENGTVFRLSLPRA